MQFTQTFLHSLRQNQYSRRRDYVCKPLHIAYQLKDNKPQLNLTNAEFNDIAVMAC